MIFEGVSELGIIRGDTSSTSRVESLDQGYRVVLIFVARLPHLVPICPTLPAKWGTLSVRDVPLN